MISTTVYLLLTGIGLLLGSSAGLQPSSLAFSGFQGTTIKVNRMLSVTLTLTLIVFKVNRILSVTLTLTPTTIKVNRTLGHGSRKRGRRFQHLIWPLSMGIGSTEVRNTRLFLQHYLGRHFLTDDIRWAHHQYIFHPEDGNVGHHHHCGLW